MNKFIFNMSYCGLCGWNDICSHLIVGSMCIFKHVRRPNSWISGRCQAQSLYSGTILWTNEHVLPYQLCFAAEPWDFLPSQNTLWFYHQMRLLKARLDSWGTTGRQNTTGLPLEARKWPKIGYFYLWGPMAMSSRHVNKERYENKQEATLDILYLSSVWIPA